MRGAADGALHLVGAVRDSAEDAAEQAAGDLRGRAEQAHLRGLKARHVAVVAFLAVELELVAAIGGEVVVVSGEGDGWHAPNYHPRGMARQHLGAAILFIALSIAFTWPLAPNLGRAVSDPGDPFINIWILDWDWWATLHQPLRLFHANAFHPAKYSLAFSENLYGLAVLLFPLRMLDRKSVV